MWARRSTSNYVVTSVATILINVVVVWYCAHGRVRAVFACGGSFGSRSAAASSKSGAGRELGDGGGGGHATAPTLVGTVATVPSSTVGR